MIRCFFFRNITPGRSFNSSIFWLWCIKPSPHLALTLALTLTLKPSPTPSLTLTLPLTLNKNPLRTSVKQKTSSIYPFVPDWGWSRSNKVAPKDSYSFIDVNSLILSRKSHVMEILCWRLGTFRAFRDRRGKILDSELNLSLFWWLWLFSPNTLLGNLSPHWLFSLNTLDVFFPVTRARFFVEI